MFLQKKMLRKKVREWYSDKNNLKIFYARPNLKGEGYEVSFSYDEE